MFCEINLLRNVACYVAKKIMQKQISKLIFLLAAFLMLPFSASAATPTISNVTGTVATRQALTITGTNMVNEDATAKSNWIDFFKTGTAYSFEGAISTDGYYYENGGAYDSAVSILGNKSVRFHASGASLEVDCPSSNLFGGYLYLNGGDLSDYWVRGYVRYDSVDNSWATSHTEMWEMMYGPSPNTYIQPGNGPSSPSQMRVIHTGDDGFGNFPEGDIQNNRWYLIEAHMTSGNVVVYVDNQQILSYGKTANLLSYFSFGLINLCGTGSSFNLYHWQDALTISSSRAYASSIIEVSGDGAIWKYQEPVTLSDTSSQIKLDLDGLTGTNYQLRVTNNQQQASAVYNLSGLSDTTPPSAPAGLLVL